MMLQDASDLLENLEEIFPWHYMDRDVISRSKYSTTSSCVIRRERVKVSSILSDGILIEDAAS